MPSLTIKGGIVAAEAYAQHRDLIARKGADYDPRVRMRIEAAGGISAADYLSVVKRRESHDPALQRCYAGAFGRCSSHGHDYSAAHYRRLRAIRIISAIIP